jgi:hypothetical protein
MELKIVHANPKYSSFKLIEPTTLGYIHFDRIIVGDQVPHIYQITPLEIIGREVILAVADL